MKFFFIQIYIALLTLIILIRIFRSNGNGGRDQGHIQWEREIISTLAGTGKLFALPVTKWWSQIKTAGAAIYANRHYLALYRRTNLEQLAERKSATINGCSSSPSSCYIQPDVYIHPSASVHPTATLGPNVSIGPDVIVGAGVRIRESIVLDNAIIKDHTLVLHSISKSVSVSKLYYK